MADTTTPLFTWSRIKGVAVVELVGRELSGPDAASHLSQQLNALLASGEKRLLLNFHRTQIMSSTAFATLFNLSKQVGTVEGELRICCMQPAVRFGADILSLGEFIPIHDTEASALASFTAH